MVVSPFSIYLLLQSYPSLDQQYQWFLVAQLTRKEWLRGRKTCYWIVLFSLYVLSYISPMTWSFYLVSILVGVGGALLWTAQGVYLTVNSDDSTISRNSGVFWALLQIRWGTKLDFVRTSSFLPGNDSLLPGNIYVYLSLKTETIDRSTRYSLFAILSVISAVSLILFLTIVWRSYNERRRSGYIPIGKVEKTAWAGIRETLKNAVKLLRTTHVRLLLIPFIYLGK